MPPTPPSSDIPEDPPPGEQVDSHLQFENRKRKTDLLEDCARVGNDDRPKHRRKLTLPAKNDKEKLETAAKYLMRAVHPFRDTGMVMDYGAAALWNPPGEMDEDEQAVQVKHSKAFNAMMGLLPKDCLSLVKEIYVDKDLTHWPMLSNMIRTSAKEARQQDTHDLKHCLQFVPSDPNVAISPPLGNGSSKSDRGINHPMLRNYIVSWTIRNRLNLAADESVDEDDSFGKTAEECLSLLLNGKIEVDQSAWPSCFYADGAYDPEDEEKGLFRSPFLARVGRTIWTAASSAMSRPKSTLPARCNARSHGVSKVNPAMIAYICVQARTMLSTTDWTADDEQFDYCIFFDSIVQLFEDDPTDPWAVETLAWFQNEIFGSASETQSSSGRKKGSAAEKILAKRKTRVAATAAP